MKVKPKTAKRKNIGAMTAPEFIRWLKKSKLTGVALDDAKQRRRFLQEWLQKGK